MKPYLLTVYQPDGPPPADVDLERVMHDLDRLNTDIERAGAWVFAGGLCPPTTARVARPDGNHVLITDGPYLEGKEHIGGFTVVRSPDLDGALEWARRMSAVIGLPIEVRPFADEPR